MPDTISTIQSNTKKLLKIAASELMDKIHFFREAEKMEEEAFKPDANGYSPGQNVSVNIPTQWLVQEDNFDITSGIQDVKERTVTMPLDMSATVAFDLDTNQLARDIDVKKVYERLVQPAILDLAANVEGRFVKKATQYVGNLVGTPGSTIVDPDTVMAGGELMDEYLAPQSQRKFLMDSASMRSAVNANKNLFTFKREEYDDAFIGNALGFDWMKNQLIYRHTNGNDVTGVQVDDGAVAEGATTLHVEGLTTTTGTLTKGSTFTINGVYAVHPQSKVTLPFLKRFSHVGSNLTADGNGDVDITLNEPLYGPGSGSLQNVSALPINDAPLVFDGIASTTYKHSLQFHKKAFRVCSVPLAMPKKAELAEQVTEQGITIALIKDFDVIKRRWITRLDFLGGVLAVRPSHATRVSS
jgi:hypothetical protein